MSESHYELIGVESDASKEEIRSAYRERIEVLRGKVENGRSDQARDGAREETAKLNAAWQVLADPVQRQRYDTRLSGGATEAERQAQEIQNRLAQCQGCHGIQGWKTAFPEVYPVPKLGGQNRAYIIAALKAYKSGERDFAVRLVGGLPQHLRADSILQSARRHDIDRRADNLVQIHEQPAEVKQTAARLQLDEKIDVALGSLITTGDRPEDSKVSDAVPPRRRQESAAQPANEGEPLA